MSFTGATRYVSVLGLGFGDCGKGHFVDGLTRRWQAHTVVRFNGGAQAGHNVIESSGGGKARRHTFSQFGAGTLVPGVRSVLADPVVVHPTALLVEAQALARIGVQDALARLSVDALCRVTTPFHQAAGRLREHVRGAAAHGTCGVGVGETVRHALAHPDEVLRYGELLSGGASSTAEVLDKLQHVRARLAAEILPMLNEPPAAPLDHEVRVLQDEQLAAKWLAAAQALGRQCPPQSADAISRQLHQPGRVVFEGAQGVLLDEWRGFHPHTTWSSISTSAVNQVAARFRIDEPVEHYGVLRSYLTRHGAGPLPTHDTGLDALPEPHNSGDGWQGPFRRGHPDAVLLRYALEAVGELHGLLVSHLDVFEHGLNLRWCEHYTTSSATASDATSQRLRVDRLELCEQPDLAHQLELTHRLERAIPHYAPEGVQSASSLLEHIAGVTKLPVVLRSYGPAYADIQCVMKP